MTTLESKLNALNFSTQLNELRDLLCETKGTPPKPTASAKITTYGTRVVEISGYTVSVSLNCLVKKVYGSAVKHCREDDLTSKERLAGLDIVGKLFSLYNQSEAQIDSVGWLTKVIEKIKEFLNSFSGFFYFSSLSSDITTSFNCFQAYSEKKFTDEFGPIGSKENRNAAYLDTVKLTTRMGTLPERIWVKEIVIRQKWDELNSKPLS